LSRDGGPPARPSPARAGGRFATARARGAPAYGNAAAESFLSTSTPMMVRLRLEDVVAFGCPLLALVDQVRESG